MTFSEAAKTSPYHNDRRAPEDVSVGAELRLWPPGIKPMGRSMGSGWGRLADPPTMTGGITTSAGRWR
jgi:hypothetical protein